MKAIKKASIKSIQIKTGLSFKEAKILRDKMHEKYISIKMTQIFAELEKFENKK